MRAIASVMVLTLGIGTSLSCWGQSVGDALRQNPQANITISGNGEVKVGGQSASLSTHTSTFQNTSSKEGMIEEGVVFSPNGQRENISSGIVQGKSTPQTVQSSLKPSSQETMRPPVAPPTSLPPLPGAVKGERPPLPPTQIPPPQDVVVQTNTSQNSYSLPQFFAQLQSEGQRLQQALGSIRINVVADDNQDYHRMLQLGKIKPQTFVLDEGIKWYFSLGSVLSTNDPSTCFVVLQTSQAEQLYNTYVKSLEGLSHPQTGYAYLVAHAVGHCLDESTRQRELNKKLQWSAEDGTYIGLLPQAIRQVYGRSFSKDTYFSNPGKINNFPLQQQYNERVADAFAVAWTIKLGGSKAFARIVSLIKQQEGAQSPLFTTPSVELMANQEKEIGRLDRADLLWDLAKLVQNKTAPQNIDVQKEQEEQEVARWIVSPQGLVPVDKHGNIIPQNNIKKDPSIPVQSLGPQGRSFDSLPRFGQ